MNEVITYQMTPKKVIKHTESATSFPGAVQPNKQIKFFKKQETIKDFGEKQRLKKRLVGERMKFFKKQAMHSKVNDIRHLLKKLKSAEGKVTSMKELHYSPRYNTLTPKNKTKIQKYFESASSDAKRISADLKLLNKTK